MTADITKINEFIKARRKIVVLQADNPDGDSLGSALALEQILHEMGKEPILYCGVDIPHYLKYLAGWDRVVSELPSDFDASIIVDTSADSLFENLEKSGQKAWVASKPVLIIDHHATASTINWATIIWNKTAVATAEVIYELAKELGWPLNLVAKEHLAAAILSDSLGLTSEAVTARSIHMIGEFVEDGVVLAKLDSRRREVGRKTAEILRYKGELLKRIEYSEDGRVAFITIPWGEIEKFSQDYNPSMLVLDEMRSVEGVDVAIAFKTYRDGKITAKIRCNYGKAIAQELAENFGGGGHAYASGFKITDGRKFDEVKSQTIDVAARLLEAKKS